MLIIVRAFGYRAAPSDINSTFVLFEACEMMADFVRLAIVVASDCSVSELQIYLKASCKYLVMLCKMNSQRCVHAHAFATVYRFKQTA